MILKGLIIWLFLLLANSVFAYDYIKGPVLKSQNVGAQCPGYYCGRQEDYDEDHYGPCGQCPRGSRVLRNSSFSLCRECQESPESYDWFYLVFMALFVLILHWISIDNFAKRRRFTKEVLLLHLSALLEVLGASILTLLSVEPAGRLEMVSCRYERLSDWYTMLYNPNPNYAETLHCTQEAIYPLYTMIFIFYAFCILLMLLIRPFLVLKVLPRRGGRAIYASLYFIPILTVIHAVGGGLIYITFPYIVVILSVISSAAHFAFKLDQSPRALLLGCVTDSRNAIILLGHWCIHAFGILAVTQLREPSLSLSLLGLVPLPSLFYIATARFSDPANFNNDMHT